MNRYAIATDLDGTIFDADARIPPESERILSQINSLGHLIVIATARPYRYVDGILPDFISKGYLVVSNGAWIIKNRKIIIRHEIPGKIVSAVVEDLSRSYVPFSIEAGDVFYSDDHDFRSWAGDWNHFSGYDGRNACKVVVRLSEFYTAKDVMSHFSEYCRIFITDGGTLAQIQSKDAGKYEAVKNVLDMENIPMTRLFAFGDDDNDVSMVVHAEYGYGMVNGSYQMLSQAKRIARPNTEEGVAVALNKYFQKGLFSRAVK